MKQSRILFLAASLGLAAGCRSIGPGTVPRDRFDYSASISDSWKRQTLLNIVKLRYLDPPIFVDVGQIVAGYSLETGLTAGGSFPENGGFGGNTATLGGSLRFTDRPTITYTPLTGNKFIKALMTPLPPDTLFFMVQSGYPADAVFAAGVAVMNGLKNQENSLGGISVPDRGFVRALELLRQIQASGAVSMRVEQEGQKQQTTLITFRAKDVSEPTLRAIQELRSLLRLDPEAAELKLVFGASASNDREIAILTRSILHIMHTMASQVEVPAQDVAEGLATPGIESAGPFQGQHLVRIHAEKGKPPGAYVAVNYRDRWFWIDDHDLRTKRAFVFMMMLFTLSETGEKGNLPLITIPAQ